MTDQTDAWPEWFSGLARGLQRPGERRSVRVLEPASIRHSSESHEVAVRPLNGSLPYHIGYYEG